MADAVWLVTALLCLTGTRWVWITGQRKGPAPLVCATAACCAPAPAPHLPVASHQSVYSHPSPKKAAIKSPLKTTTGLDSHKLEQNNLFPLSASLSFSSFLPPNPHLRSLPSPLAARSDPSRSSALAGAAGTARSHAVPCCLRMCAVLMRADSIRQHFFSFQPGPAFLLPAWLPALASSCLKYICLYLGLE